MPRLFKSQHGATSICLVVLCMGGALPGCFRQAPTHENAAGHEENSMPAHAVAIPQVPELAEPTEPTMSIERRAMALAASEFVHVVAEQKGVDITLRLLGSQGFEVSVDSPNGRWGKEELIAQVPTAGTYQLEVEAKVLPDSDGTWELHRVEHRPPSPRDLLRLRADEWLRAGIASRRAKDHEVARQHLEAALELWHQLQLPAWQAETQRELGFVLQALNQLKEARRRWQQTLDWYQANGERRRSFLLYNLGTLEVNLGSSAMAIPYLEEALELLTEQESERGIEKTLQALILAYRRQGRWQDAIDAYSQARDHAQQGQDPAREAALSLQLGKLELALDRLPEATEATERALQIYRTLGDPLRQAHALQDQADLALFRKDFATAEDLAHQALATLPADAPIGRQLLAWTTIGNVKRNRQDWPGAIDAYTKALEFQQQEADTLRNSGIVLTALAHSHFLAGHAQRAYELHQQAVANLRRVDNAADLGRALARSAQALLALGRSAEAEAHAIEALGHVESIRSSTRRQDHRRSYFESRQDYYQIAIDIQLHRYAQEGDTVAAQRALETHDRRLAREILEAQPVAEEPASVEQMQRLSELESRLSQAVQDQDDATAIALLDELHTARDSAKNERPIPIIGQEGLPAIQQALDEHTLALVYVLTNGQPSLFVVGQDMLSVHPLASPGELDDDIHALVACLRQTNLRSQEKAAELSRRLGDRLLAPVAERLASHSRLVIVAEGPLIQLPFTVLTVPHADHRLLIESHEIIHLPSLSVLPLLRSRQPTRSGNEANVTVFADPVFQANDPRLLTTDGTPAAAALVTTRVATGDTPDQGSRRLLRAARDVGAGPLRRLPATLDEAEAVRRSLPPTAPPRVFLGLEASRQRFLYSDWRDTSILHFATHALAHPRAELSGVVLSTHDSDGRPNAGLVTGAEISQLSLPVDLVVLSGCETAVGREQRGEAALGLSWSFFQAGARSVVATLWRVDDQRTASIMASFLTAHLQAGDSPAAALRSAQLEVLRQPDSVLLDWAGFVFVGDWQSRRPSL